MDIWIDAFIGILIVIITVIPFFWKGKKSKYILIAIGIFCIGLYVWQGFSKYKKDKGLDSLKEKNLIHQQEIINSQDTMNKKLDKLLEVGAISKKASEEIKNIFYEAIFSASKSESVVEDELISSNIEKR